MTRERAGLAAARSWLFVPGDRPDRFDTAARSKAHVVVVDLQDAVAAGVKHVARAAAANWLHGTGTAVVRVNSDRDEQEADLALLAGAPGVVGVMVPEAEDPARLDALHRLVGVPLVALVETAAGIAGARRIAAVPGVGRLAIGLLDLSLDLAVATGSPLLEMARWEVVMASRLASSAAPIDAVTVQIGDGAPAGVAARQARRDGFGGKLCIHPVQAGPVNAAFAPSSEEIEWARRVVAASGDGSAARVDGAMVDRPVHEQARRILARLSETTED